MSPANLRNPCPPKTRENAHHLVNDFDVSEMNWQTQRFLGDEEAGWV